MRFITDNIGTLAVLAVLLLIIGAIIGGMIRKKKSGKAIMCDGCEGCAMKGQCHRCINK